MTDRLQVQKTLIHPSMLLNANRPRHFHEEARMRKDLQQIGRLAFGRHFSPVTVRTRVDITICFPQLDAKGRKLPQEKLRDMANWAPTGKPLVDGLTMAEVWPDDNDRWVSGPNMLLGPTSPDRLRCEFWIALQPEPKVVPAAVRTDLEGGDSSGKSRGRSADTLCMARVTRAHEGRQIPYCCTRQPHGSEAQHRAVSDIGELIW